MSNPKMENWGFVGIDDPYTAPECIRYQLVGNVYNHPSGRLEDGAFVHTSKVVSINWPRREVQTRNTLYELGAPNPDFVKVVEPGTFTYNGMVEAGYITEVGYIAVADSLHESQKLSASEKYSSALALNAKIREAADNIRAACDLDSRYDPYQDLLEIFSLGVK